MDIIQRPILTEKYTVQGEKLNKYGFVVTKISNKIEIKKAIEKMYNVTVLSVNTIQYGGKSKMRYTKKGVLRGKTNAHKKAIVTLNEGEVIDFYSNI